MKHVLSLQKGIPLIIGLLIKQENSYKSMMVKQKESKMEQNVQTKKTVLSGVQPTSGLTLGNYLRLKCAFAVTQCLYFHFTEVTFYCLMSFSITVVG